MLSARLALTKRQQKEIRPFLQELHRETLALEDDRSLTPAALLAAVRPYRKQTDARIRSVLSDRQKQKLDEIERQPHREIHGDVSGSALAAQH
jgi:hypothetical protein